MDVFDLVAKISLNSSEYKNGLNNASNETSRAADAIGAAMAVGSAVAVAAISAITVASVDAGKKIWELANDTAEFADNIDKSSQKLGLSSKAYQEWSYVLNLTGTDISSMSAGIKTLTNKLDDARNGSEETIATFQMLGISIEDINELSREDLFARTIEGFQGMADTTERAALANDIFGRSSQELTPLFNQTAEATKEQIAVANEYGMVMSEDAVKAGANFEDSLTKLEGTFNGLKNSMSSELIPAITMIMDGMSDMAIGSDTASEKIENGFGMVVDAINNILDNISSMVEKFLPKIIEIAPKIISSLANGIVSAFPFLIETGTEILLTIVNTMVDLLPIVFDGAIQLIVALAEGIGDALPELIPSVVEAIIMIVQTLLDNIELIIDAATKLVIGLAEGLVYALPILIDSVPEIIGALLRAIQVSSLQLVGAALQLMVVLAGGIISAIPHVVAAIPMLIYAIIDAGYKYAVDDFPRLGMQIVDGLWQGIQGAWGNITSNFESAIGGLVDSAKNILGIHSPSKVFAGIGGFMAEGLEDGWNDQISDAMDTIDKDLEFSATPYDNNVKTSYNEYSSNDDSSGQFIIPIYIGTEMIDEYIVDAQSRKAYKSGGR